MHRKGRTFALQRTSVSCLAGVSLFTSFCFKKSAMDRKQNYLLKHLVDGFILSEESAEVDVKKTVLEIFITSQPISHSKSIRLTLGVLGGAIVSCDALSLRMLLDNILGFLADGLFKNHQDFKESRYQPLNLYATTFEGVLSTS